MEEQPTPVKVAPIRPEAPGAGIEIRDYVRARKARLKYLVIVPLIVAVLAAALLFLRPKRYEAKTTVLVPSSVTANATASAVSQYVANFEQAITSSATVDRVARETHTSSSAIAGSRLLGMLGLGQPLTVSQVGNSNLIEVSFESTSRAKASKVVTVAAHDTLDLLAGQQKQVATRSATVSQAQVDAAQKQYDTDRNALDAFLNQNGLVLPKDQYQSMLSEVSTLQAAVQVQQATGFSDRAHAIQTILDARQKDLDALGAKVLSYQHLQDALTASTDNLSKARQQLAADQALQGQAGTVVDPLPPVTQPASRTKSAVKSAIILAGLAFLVVGGVIVLLELRERPGRRTGEAKVKTKPAVRAARPKPVVEPPATKKQTPAAASPRQGGEQRRTTEAVPAAAAKSAAEAPVPPRRREGKKKQKKRRGRPPVPATAAASKPEPVARPEPAVAAKPEPVARPEPAASPVPVARQEPAARPAPAASPVPVARQEPAARPAPEPVARPAPAASPVPVAREEPVAPPGPSRPWATEPAPARSTGAGPEPSPSGSPPAVPPRSPAPPPTRQPPREVAIRPQPSPRNGRPNGSRPSATNGIAASIRNVIAGRHGHSAPRPEPKGDGRDGERDRRRPDPSRRPGSL